MKYVIYLITWFLSIQLSIAKTPKNIILFIGDGMGPAQITAARTIKGELQMDRFKIGGFALTHSFENYVTDSAAGATAMATGYKSYNGAISVAPETFQPLKTILEYAEEKGKKTGLVATSTINHATPACFAAHVKKRNLYEDIALDMSKSGVDVLIGGGRGYFLPKGEPGSKRTDEEKPLENMQGGTFVYDYATLSKIGQTDKLIALLELDELPPALKRTYTLSLLTQKAIALLSSDKDGFFLMVEGSQIDWGGHDNNKDYLLSEMRDFDEAIGAALDFAEDDGKTLVIVTADHETGGLSLMDGSLEEKDVELKFATGHHTAVMVPVFAYGPGAEAFGGIQQNTNIGQSMINFWK
ncbi:alkaline phosphatase [candidate division KSB1 bacterium]|nr:alkaline phosphatase [candidate division KSB1 bacterium]